MTKKKKIILAIVLPILILLLGGTLAYVISSTNEGNIGANTGKVDVIYTIEENVTATALYPTTEKESGLKSVVKARLNTGSLPGLFSIYIKVEAINNLGIPALRWEVEGKNASNNIIVYEDGSNFSGVTSGTKIPIVNNYNLSYTDTTFDIYIWLDSNELGNTNINGSQFRASISADTKNITGNGNGIVAPNETLSQTITNLYANAPKVAVTNNNITYNTAPSVSLMNDRLGGTTTSLDGGNIRYYGASPNNYIYFNCSDYNNQSDTTCEKWRIIGVFDGKVKLVRNSSIGNFVWDTSDTLDYDEYDCPRYGKNNWGQADLMKLLNPGYESETVGGSLYYNSGSGTCYTKGANATSPCNFTNTGLKNGTTKNLIADTKYYLGSASNNYVIEESYPNQIYIAERSNTIYPGNPTSWTGKIGLAYPSDWGYATDLSQCTNTMIGYSEEICFQNSWFPSLLDEDIETWSITPHSDFKFGVTGMTSSGTISNDFADGNGYVSSEFADVSVIPVLYLKSSLMISSGNGISGDPYRLQVS